ncbi:hypothetical protein KL919_005372 [Ogataea angusta]|nr:hypothetical protein KL919_005372 [Ogataea angusta]
MSDTYVVVGAGIVGLYTAYTLVFEAGVSPETITIAAAHIPGDQSINYTSPWAGGNFSCISPGDKKSLSYDRYTYTHLAELQKKLGGPSCGLDMRPATDYFHKYPPAKKMESLKAYVKDFRILEKSALPTGIVFGISYTTWNFNCPLFLQNLALYLEKLGVTIIKKKLEHLSQAFLSPNTKVVLNCTGIGAITLGGVKDTNVYPTRGQVVVVKAPHIQFNMCLWTNESATYIIPRPNSNGELVIGGFLQKGISTGDTFKHETEDIIKRATTMAPLILEKPLDVVRVAAGLRPSRHGGPRIEVEEVEDGKFVVHNYGASGYGYQGGWGMAHDAVRLLIKAQRGSSAAL